MSTTPPAARSPDQTGGYKRSARNYLLDSRFQLRYAGYLMGVAVVICGVMGAVLYSTTQAMVEESQKVVEEARKVYEESRKVSEVSRMNIHDLAGDSPELLAEFTKAAAERDQMIAAEQKSIQEQQTMLLGRQGVILRVLVGGMAAMVVLIGMLGIFFTHKVAGPIYKMKRLLADVGRGNLRVETRLRKGDELQDFFEVFSAMVSSLRGIQRKHVDDLSRAMETVEAGDRGEAAAAVGRVRDAMKSAIDG